MALILNISNSADYQSMIRSTTSSEDEDDLHSPDHFLTPTSETDFSSNYGVVEINQNDNDSIRINELSQSSTIIHIPEYHNYLNLSTSSSETSLARPLLNSKHQPIPIYTGNIEIKSSTSSTFSYYSFLKLYLVDMFIAAFVITPLVNVHWRGAWDLLDLYLLPTDARTSALVSLIIGLFILYIIYLSQNSLQRFYEKYRKHFLGQTMARFYTLFIALAYINQWRGLWNLLDLTSNQWYLLLIETFLSIIVLLIMKSIYNLNSAPFLIGTDTESYFLLGSKFKISNHRFRQYIFDFIFYELIEAPLVIIAWRGLYNLSDLYIYPENKTYSMLASFTIGYSLFFLLALLQIPFIRCLIQKQHQTIYAMIANGFHLLAFVSVVQIWRSLWIICEQYINIPEYHHLTLWLCYIGAYVVLTCGLAACTLNGPGGAKDGFMDDQPILLFQFEYFSTLLKSQTGQSKVNKGNDTSSESSSIDTLMPPECPFSSQPP